MKISIITPSYNSGRWLERAIKSVLDQDYDNYEHIVVDGGSTDETLKILEGYPHLQWISEPDRGQVEAMNKGFNMSTGEIISYLNADDYYLKGTFSAVIPRFEAGAKMVMGKVLVYSEKPGGCREWACDAATDFPSVLRHWNFNAFCVNPVGYFYRREVQEKIPLREESGAKHDLEFLIEVALAFSTDKIDRFLGVFNHALDTQTGREQLRPSYWAPETFPFIDRLALHLSPRERKQFFLERERGYQLRRRWTAGEALALGGAEELFNTGEVFFIPEDEDSCRRSRCGFVEHDGIATPGDWIIPVFTSGRVASKSVCSTLKELPPSQLPARVYHIHQMNPETINRELPSALTDGSHLAVGLALKHLQDEQGDRLHWKYIAGVRDPVAAALSAVFEIWPSIEKEQVEKKVRDLARFILEHFTEQYLPGTGINVYRHPFDREKGYTIIKEGHKSLLIYRFEDLSRIFPAAMEDYLGFPGLKLLHTNVGEARSEGRNYAETRESITFSREFLDQVYSSPYCRHFYSGRELESFYRRWATPGKGLESKRHDHYHGLIYDLGFHIGQDTEFYLKKGFSVIAVEANPVLVDEGARRFASYLASGQLVLIKAGLVEDPVGEEFVFYVNERRTSWSSFVYEIAAREGDQCLEVKVPCVAIKELVERYGEPYFVKIDIEGYDLKALRGLKKSGARPLYVSVENGNRGMVNLLLSMGYDRFKYVKQNDLPRTILPYPPLEGDYVEHTFIYGSSGPFGEEAPGSWEDAAAVKTRIAKIWDPEGTARNPDHIDSVHGWFDLHAKKSLKPG